MYDGPSLNWIIRAFVSDISAPFGRILSVVHNAESGCRSHQETGKGRSFFGSAQPSSQPRPGKAPLALDGWLGYLEQSGDLGVGEPAQGAQLGHLGLA